MKNTTFLAVILLLVSIEVNAQVGIGTTTPDPSAILDVVSTNKGALLPRVVNVTTITTPVAGLMIYDSTKQCMKYFNGTIWSDCMGGILPALFNCGDSMTDIDGNTYPTIQIGGQCWMAADLKVRRYPNGNPIPYIDDLSTWWGLNTNNTSDAYNFYGDDNNDGIINIAYPDYGALYTYAAAIADNWTRDNSAINSAGGQGICPDGWHLPTNTEWTTLTTFLGGISTAGGEMKETGTTHWDIPNTGATNSSGFTALPGSYVDIYIGSGVSGMGLYGYWWTSTETASNTASYRNLRYDTDNVNSTSGAGYKSYGFSVRCVRN